MTPARPELLSAITTGFTHYVSIGKDDDAAIFYENEEAVHMRLPGAATVMHGKWKLLDDGYFVKWLDGPEGKWQIANAPGAFLYIDPSGKQAMSPASCLVTRQTSLEAAADLIRTLIS